MEKVERPRVVDFHKAVAAFGGYSSMARRLGVPLSTCHGWARRGKLPPWRACEIARLAESEKLNVYKRRGGARRSKPKTTA